MAANDVLVIPHAGQMHNYHVTVSKVPVEVFWYISTAGPWTPTSG